MLVGWSNFLSATCLFGQGGFGSSVLLAERWVSLTCTLLLVSHAFRVSGRRCRGVWVDDWDEVGIAMVEETRNSKLVSSSPPLQPALVFLLHRVISASGSIACAFSGCKPRAKACMPRVEREALQDWASRCSEGRSQAWTEQGWTAD